MHACSLKGLSDADIAALQRLVDDQVAENLGMAMIYTIIAAAQEWLRDKVCHNAGQPHLHASYMHSAVHEIRNLGLGKP